MSINKNTIKFSATNDDKTVNNYEEYFCFQYGPLM